MGLAVNTNNKFDYVLEQHRALPADEQPSLQFRFLSAKDHGRMDQLFDEVNHEKTKLEDMVRLASEGVAIGLVGWKGYDEPFNGAGSDAILSRIDLMELVRELSSAMTVSMREKKASVLRSLSTTAKSANDSPAIDPASV